ncbi:LOW QUALITY PROTEIN: hypothetical protein Cgig2_009848 [Carnegiea gigantea]|uniref:Aminotransferase-like plant mobile domain-containing protein n=1 Tax=Carnegiea gigantea TaxID=171969 RepID=A0A9Q1QL99_9CARY|nr:LOW QUALITY PROTEIN: hypothetical protein Cgig2_009848 [Carnegiea gigantea]
MADLNVTAEGELAVFLAFWLSCFVLSHGSHKARNICNGCIDGFWAMNFFGPNASDPDHPGKANIIFPSHYVIGWLAELFPSLYHHCPDSNCPGDFPTLIYYARLLGSKLSLPQAKHILRAGRYLSLRAGSYREDSRNGGLRQQRNIMDLVQAHADLQRRDTGAKFYVPPSYYKGLWVTVVPRKNLRYYPLKKEKPRDLLASRARVSQSLSILHSTIDIYKLSTMEICWLSSKIDEIFSIIESAVKIEELVDVDRVKGLFDQDLTCSSEIAHIKDQLNNLSSKVSKLKVKEQEVLREEEWIRKMQEDLTI